MKLRKCTECGAYSLKSICRCGGRTVNPHPPKYYPGRAAYARLARKRTGVHEDKNTRA